MKQFEYKCDYFSNFARVLDTEYLDELGLYGWELVSVVPYQEVSSGPDGYYVYYKREIKNG